MARPGRVARLECPGAEEATAPEVWQQLRQGARNIAGVTYQIAVTADLLVAGAASRPGWPSVRSVLPEGWEDVDVSGDAARIFVQAKERSAGSERFGASALADVIAHAARGIQAAGELETARIAVVTDAGLAQGIKVTGWDTSVAESLPTAERSRLEALLGERLEAAGMIPTLCSDLTMRTFVVSSPWNGAADTQRDLASAYKVHPAVAWLTYAVLTERLARLAAEQRSSSVRSAAAFTATDLEALVEHVATSVDLDSLAEAVAAGVCAAVDFLAPSELTQADFLRGVSAAPAHIAAGLDVERPAELTAILDGLNDRRHVLVAGPSGSGKSTLMWRSAQLLTLRARIVRVYRVQSEDDIVLLLRHVLRSQPSGAAPVVICADDVGAPAMSLWSTGLARVLEIPHVYVLSTVRREDYLPSQALGGVVIDSALDAASAAALYAALGAADLPRVLELEEATDRARGLLMEFVALVTTGTRLRDVLAEQLQQLRHEHRRVDRMALRIVSAVHSLGHTIDAAALATHLGLSDVDVLGDALSRLQDEHLVIHDVALGEWRGIHDLRVAIIQELLHQSPPPTLAETMCEALALVAPASQPRALVRAADLVAEHAQRLSTTSDRQLDRLVATLRPLASRARAFFESPADPVVRTPARWSGLLEAAMRLDAIAYAYATFPLAQAGCPAALDPAAYAGLLYNVRVDEFDLSGLPVRPELWRDVHAMPEYDTRLSAIVADGASPAGLVEIASDAGTLGASRLLEAAESLIDLEPEQARELWVSLVPSLPSPPGEGLDGEGADLRARVAAGLSSLAGLTGEAVAEALGPTYARAEDAVAADPDAAAVSLKLEPRDPSDDAASPIKARAQTWSAGELLVAEASLLYRSDAELATAYAHGPNEGDGVNRRVVRLCRRLLDACPEVDRADISGVGADWEAIHYDDMVFGKYAIRAGVLGFGPSVRRNIAYQAAVGRMSTAVSLSARIRLQAELAQEVEALLSELPRRIRVHDNQRRAQGWKNRVHAAERRISALPRRPAEELDTRDESLRASDEVSRARDPEQAAFAALIGGLAAASEGIESGDRTRYNHAADQVARARPHLVEARERGVPRFASVADPLPATLDLVAAKAERLLLGCGIGGAALRRLRAASSDPALFAELDTLSREQEAADRTIVTTWLEGAGVDDARATTITDEGATPPRLNHTRTLIMVPLETWEHCVQVLEGPPPSTWDETTGRFVVVPVHLGMMVPIATSSIGAGGSWMPIVDYDEFVTLGDEAGLPVLSGPNSTIFREVVAPLLKWSEAVELRARRPSTWVASPMPSPSPESIRESLEALLAPESTTEASHELLEALIALADTVAAEDGKAHGLAAKIVHAVANPSAETGPNRLSELAVVALAADLPDAAS